MRKWVFILLHFFLFVYAGADTLYVSERSHLKSIKQAISSAKINDVIIIEKGIYNEGVININKSLHLIGKEQPVIHGENKHQLLTITADNVIVEGIHFKDVGISHINDLSAIQIVKSKNCIIRNNLLTNAFFGILVQYSAHCIIENNIIKGTARNEMNTANAIHLWYCKHVKISNNKAMGHRDGIYLEFVDSSIIKDNYIHKNIRYGLHFMFSNDNVYHNNTFKSNNAGVAVMFSKSIEMNLNTFIENRGTASYGLLLKDITDSEIQNNIFDNNTTGLYAEGSNRNFIHNNDFKNNGWAIRMLGSSYDNVIENNNFIQNNFDVSTNSKLNNNTFQYNYWSKYSGYDLDKNGLGDVPYRPVSLFSYIVGKSPDALILLRSNFIRLLNYVEIIAPVLTPDNLIDNYPLMKQVNYD